MCMNEHHRHLRELAMRDGGFTLLPFYQKKIHQPWGEEFTNGLWSATWLKGEEIEMRQERFEERFAREMEFGMDDVDY